MMMNFRRRDARPLLRALIAISALGCAVLVGAGLVVVRAASSDSVQAIEVNLAGTQRRLSERIAYDVALLDLDPADVDARSELASTADLLRRTREGLLGGDKDLQLDGELPGRVRDLYQASGLDLSARMERYESAALEIAESVADDVEAPVDVAEARATIDVEANGQRLVRDLNTVVSELDSTLEGQRLTRRSTAVVTFGLLGGLAAVTLAIVILALRRASRQITEAKRLGAELADSEAIYRSTIDALVDGVIIQDRGGRVVRMNEAARTTLSRLLGGRTPGYGQSFFEFLPPMIEEDGTPLTAENRPVMRAFETGRPVVGQVLGAEIDGTEYWFRCNASIVEDGSNVRAVLAFRDVTEERRLAQLVESEKRRFRLAVKHAPIGTFLIDTDRNAVEANTALGELLTCDPESIVGRSLSSMLHAESRGEVGALIDSIQHGEESVRRLETRMLDSAGHVVDVLLAAASIDPTDDGSANLIVQVLDIRERARAEAAHRSALRHEREMVEKLTELDRAKNDFVSTVSHELRTPLTSVLGYLEMLADGTAGPMSSAQTRIVGTMSASGAHLLELIEDLLAILTLDNGRTRRDVSRHDLFTLVQTVSDRLQPIADRGDVTLSNLVDPDIGPIDGDRSQLERVLLNLVGNAIKFTPAGGLVTVTGRRDDTGGYSIDVIDTGVGIPDDEQQHLFTRFFRSSTALRDAIPGTGLGLAITAEMVRDHGGEVSLSSLEGVGTTAHLRLPACDRAADDGDRSDAADSEPVLSSIAVRQP